MIRAAQRKKIGIESVSGWKLKESRGQKNRLKKSVYSGFLKLRSR